MTARLTAAAFILAFTVAAATQLLAAMRDRPLVEFARSLERLDNPAAPDDDLSDRLEAEIGRRPGCDHLRARSRVTVSIYLLEHSDPEDVETFQRRLLSADRQAREGLACNPLDGNLWFVAGWLRYQLVPNKSLLHEFLLNAIRFAPNHGAALARRWRVLAPHLHSLGFADDPAIFQDLATLYRASNIRIVASVHDALRRNGSSALAEGMLGKIESKRREALQRQLELLTPSTSPREFLRFGPRI